MRVTMDAIKEHKQKVLEIYPEDKLLGVFVYGSQNYNINTENSDVDTKAILIPTIEDLCLRQPVTRELHLENGEHCEIKDIREMVKMFKKQNINFLEILYTDYYVINPKYNTIWRKYFIDNRERITHMDIRKAILSTTGQAINTLKKNNISGKDYANGIRLYYTLKNLINGIKYKRCIDMSYQGKFFVKKLIDYKNNIFIPSEKEIEILKESLNEVSKLANNYPAQIDASTCKLLEKGIIALITNDFIDFDFYKDF